VTGTITNYAAPKGEITAPLIHRARLPEEQKLSAWMDGGQSRNKDTHTRKDQIAKSIADEMMKSPDAVAVIGKDLSPKDQRQAMYYAADNRTRNWAGTSADNDQDALRLQYSASQLFNVPMHGFTQDQHKQLDKYLNTIESTTSQARADNLILDREYLKAIYNQTQAQLKADGLDYVTLYRGIDLKTEHIEHIPVGGRKTTEIRSRPLSSFSSKKKMATEFAGNALMEVRVPRSRVFSTARTGLGCWSEDEFVLLGGPAKARIRRRSPGGGYGSGD